MHTTGYIDKPSKKNCDNGRGRLTFKIPGGTLVKGNVYFCMANIKHMHLWYETNNPGSSKQKCPTNCPLTPKFAVQRASGTDANYVPPRFSPENGGWPEPVDMPHCVMVLENVSAADRAADVYIGLSFQGVGTMMEFISVVME